MTSEALPSDTVHGYETLTPDVVMDALAAVGLMGDGRMLTLSSYENRVYQLHLEDGSAVVAKFYRPKRWSDTQIREEHAFAAELMTQEIPVVGPLVLNGQTLHHHAGFSFSVSPSRGGRSPELDDFEVLEWIGRFLGRIHTVGASKPFASRPALNLQTFGYDSRDWLLQNNMVPLDVQGDWVAACNRALGLIEAQMKDAQTGVGTPDEIRLHGDCHRGNILWVEDQGPHFVDLDDARSGPAIQDFWMLLSGDRGQRTQALSAMLEGYEQFRAFDRRELRLIEPLRTLRLIHYSAWLARRWDDPAFPINFPWFGTSDYWQGQVQMLNEQIEQMQEAPLEIY